MNETTIGENFAEKWNNDPTLPAAFYTWHKSALKFFEEVVNVQGLDAVQKELSANLGESATSKAFAEYGEVISSARGSDSLKVASGIGLAVGPAKGTQVRKNTFFGSTGF
jgi:hypothetical protein